LQNGLPQLYSGQLSKFYFYFTFVFSNAYRINSTHYSKCKEILNVYLSSPGIYLYKGTKFGG